MSFTVLTNIITILFCLAVLVQSMRMMRSLKQVREGRLDHTVAALDTATASARSVLADLKQTLSIEGTANARTLGEAREVREELNIMVGIANAMAERLMEAASTGSHSSAAPVAEPAKPSRTARPARRTTPAKTAKAEPARSSARPEHQADKTGKTDKLAPAKAPARKPRKAASRKTTAKELA